MTLALCLVASPAAAQVFGPPAPAAPVQRSRFDRTSLGIFAAGTVLTLAALDEENAARATASLEQAGPIEAPIDVGDTFGSTWTMLGITAGMGAIGYFGNRPAFSNAAIDMGRTLAVTGVIVGGLKLAVDRTRPNNAGHSFPSGHTAVAFAGATVLERYFGWKVGVATYSLATFTALGRMEDNKHYLSDVIAGATIGLLAGRLVPSRVDSRVSTFVGPDAAGLSVNF